MKKMNGSLLCKDNKKNLLLLLLLHQLHEFRALHSQSLLHLKQRIELLFFFLHRICHLFDFVFFRVCATTTTTRFVTII